ncbi:trypsin-like serine protease, partial [Neoconidiobolus thromboides FSU 785]
YPFMALISDQKTQCGGAFIKQDVVLTAAHCMNKDIDYNVKNFKVMLHRFRLDVDLDSDNSKPFSIQQVIFHPEYNFNKKSGTPNDIVILKINNDNLKEYLGINLNNMITLDDGKYSKVGEGAKLLGWGTTYKQLETNKKGKPSLVLKEMNLKLVNEKLCNFVGYKRGYNLCTQGLSMDDIPCKGDSGSPLFHLSEDTTLPVLVGLVSFGDLECKSYSAFVKISAYLDFINEF